MSQPLTDALRAALAGSPLPLVGDADGRLCPGASLWTAARTWAAWLRQSGLQPGDRLAVSLPNGRLFVVLFLASLRAGVTFCPLPMRLPAAERTARLRALDPALSVGTPGSPAPAVHLDPAAIDPPDPVTRLSDAQGRLSADLAVILWSSGTSGQPRAIGLSQTNLLAQATAHLPLLGLDRRSRVVSHLSWSHCFGFGIELLPALLSGAELHASDDGGRDPHRLLDVLQRHRPTHLFTVPQVLESLMDQAGGPEALASLQGGVVGGACLHPGLAARLSEAAVTLRQGYGQTECAPGVTLGGPGDFRPGLIGRAVGCELRLADDGELWVRGPNVHAECWSGPAPRMQDGWLATGDLASRDDQGDWHWLGRRDACFKLANGRMVNPRQVEAQILAQAPEVAEVIAVGRGHRRVVPLLRLRPGTSLAGRTWELGTWVAPPQALPEALWHQATGPTGKTGRAALERIWQTRTEAAS